MHKIKIIAGATASGKSAAAMKYAMQNNAAIINCDSQQIYSGLEILTASPSEQDKSSCEHYLYNILSLNQPFSVGIWFEMLRETLAKVDNAVIVGGSGMYISALINGLSPIPEIEPQYRQQAKEMLAKWQGEPLELLSKYDAKLAGILHNGDTQRITRALEVAIALNKPLSYWQELPRIKPFPDIEFDLEIISIAREILYSRINERFETMLEDGVLEEISRLMGMGEHELPAASAIIGVRELCQYLQGEIDLPEARRIITQKTRNYAKRQMTWLRSQLDSGL